MYDNAIFSNETYRDIQRDTCCYKRLYCIPWTRYDNISFVKTLKNIDKQGTVPTVTALSRLGFISSFPRITTTPTLQFADRSLLVLSKYIQHKFSTLHTAPSARTRISDMLHICTSLNKNKLERERERHRHWFLCCRHVQYDTYRSVFRAHYPVWYG